jgi:hypothetical protein
VGLSLVLAGCKGNPQTNTNQTENTTETTASSQPEQNANQPFSGTLKAAVALGVPMKCTYKTVNNEGTSYISGKQFYSETTVNKKDVRMIVKDNCMWSWTNGEKQGIKACFETTGDNIWEGDTAKAPASNDTQIPAKAQFDCNPSIVDANKFNPPSEVTFTSLDDMMKNINVPLPKNVKIPQSSSVPAAVDGE